MRRILSCLLVGGFVLLSGCSSAPAAQPSQTATTGESTQVMTATTTKQTTSSLTTTMLTTTTVTAATTIDAVTTATPPSNFTALDREEQTSLLVSCVWQVVGEGNKVVGYYLLSDEDLQGKRYYYRFYSDFTMHEWADDTTVNKLYKWEWTQDNKLKVTNYADKTGQSASSWYFDATYLINENLNTQDFTPHGIASTYPAEPPIIK